MPRAVPETVARVFRAESPRLIGALARLLRDVGLAEDVAQEALVAALEQWPREGVPSNPAAWLMRTAQHRAIDLLRRGSLVTGHHEAVAGAAEDWSYVDFEARLDDVVGDDVLRLMFVASHPVLPSESQVVLTLRLVGGLTTGQIARAFLVSEAAIAQRVVRAKRALAEARLPFELPSNDDVGERLASVLGVIYFVFNEGYSASSGDEVVRPALADEALRLGRLLAKVGPDEPEVHALVALMEFQSSRFESRRSADGTPVPLASQDRSSWDQAAIARGVAALARTQHLGGDLGVFALQAAIASCHALAPTASDTDWGRIAALYDVLASRWPQPVVALNRAVAHAMLFGPATGLALLSPLAQEPALADYSPFHAVRGDLLERAGLRDEGAQAFLRAAATARTEREQVAFSARAQRLKSGG